MKKTLILIFCLTLAAVSLSVAVSAATAIGEVHVPYAKYAPTLDGVISASEWDASKKTTFSSETATLALSTLATYNEDYFTFFFDMYYQWDEEYLYMAWDVHAERKFFDQGGNYVRIYLDPDSILYRYCEEKGNELEVGMPRVVAATRSDGTGIYAMQQLGIDNINFESTEYCYKETGYGWIYEVRVPWISLEDSLAAKTGKTDVTINVDAGMKIRANYDYYDITEDKSNKGFLTTSMEQEFIATNVWNYSKYADILLVLDAENGKQPETQTEPGEPTAPVTEELPAVTEPADGTSSVPEATEPPATDTTVDTVPAPVTEDKASTGETAVPSPSTGAEKETSDESGEEAKAGLNPWIIIVPAAVVIVAVALVIALKKKK
ncbi:MAG: hypothetical protein IKS28_08150 [Clostridia bacterium]|nr:hypothetical protein [Clostridia bacterium]